MSKLSVVSSALLFTAMTSSSFAAPVCVSAPSELSSVVSSNNDPIGSWINPESQMSIQFVVDMKDDKLGLLQTMPLFGSHYSEISICKNENRTLMLFENSLYEFKVTGNTIQIAKNKFKENRESIFQSYSRALLKAVE